MIGVDGALYKILEFTGEGVQSLTMDDRLCICNMAIEAGAKNGIFPVDEITEALPEGPQPAALDQDYEADPDAEYERTITIDLTTLEPTVSCPHLPENTHTGRRGAGTSRSTRWSSAPAPTAASRICRPRYEILKGKHVAKGVRGIIIPATQGSVQGMHQARLY